MIKMFIDLFFDICNKLRWSERYKLRNLLLEPKNMDMKKENRSKKINKLTSFFHVIIAKFEPIILHFV